MFVQSKERARELFQELKYDVSLRCDVVSSEKSKQERDRTMERFRKGEVFLLICTDLMARGIDFKGVNLVIN